MSLIILKAIVALLVSLGMMTAAIYGKYPSLDYTKKVMLVACEPETVKMTDEQRSWLGANGWKLEFTGVGKVNAAIATTNAIWRYRNAKAFVNVGTCGSQTLPKGALVVPNMVAQRDMDATLIMREFVPDFPKHLTPFMEEIFGKIDLSNFVLPTGVKAVIGGKVGTGDNTHAHLEESDFLWDCVEMELAAVVAAIQQTGFNGKFLSLKWVSDTADENAGEDWQENADGIPWDDILKILDANF
tara:strand:- start:41 stop:769 length:729 start_codon:yes stop_codon:yes gene_type:complete